MSVDRTILAAISALLLIGLAGAAAAADQTAFNGPHAIPGRIQAEDYDNGGAGVAYSDTTSVNFGGAGRLTEAVDIETVSGNTNIGWIVDGEWTEYSITVATGGTYTATFRVGSWANDRKIALTVDGAAGCTITVPNTGSTEIFTTTSAPLALSAGTHVVRLTYRGSGQNIDWFEVAGGTTPIAPTAAITIPPAQSGQTAYNGPHALPSRVQAEDYDNGGAGVAYSDTTSVNFGGAGRLTEAVDIETVSGNTNIGWIADGEWTEYSVTVATGGTYTATFRVGSWANDRKIALTVDGAAGCTITVPNTGSTEIFTTTSAPLALSAGTHVVRLTYRGSGQNIDWFEVAGGTTPIAPTTAPTSVPVTAPGVQPVAGFTASPTSGVAPLAVQFTDTSTGSPRAWAWDFNNDGTVDSTEQNPVCTKKYTVAGTYTVKLTVTNANGSDSEVKTNYITAIPTAVPTTLTTTAIPAAVPTTLSSSPSAAELQARLDNAKATANSRLAEKRAALQAWAIPSRPDLVAVATNARTAGLKIDGTDNTAVLQSLLNTLPAGATLYFPAGTYRINGPIRITKPLTLFGEMGTVFDCTRTTASEVFSINAGGSLSSKMAGVTFMGFVVEGPGIESEPMFFINYNLQNAHYSYVKFHNIGDTAIWMRGCAGAVVEDCVFDNVYRTGLGYGVAIMDYCDGITVRDNFFVTKGRHAVSTGVHNSNYEVPAAWPRQITVENNFFQGFTNQACDAHHWTAGSYIVRGNVIVDSSTSLA